MDYCRRGHAKTPENVYVYEGRTPVCKICRRASDRRYYAEGRKWSQQPENQRKLRDAQLDYYYRLTGLRYAKMRLDNRRWKAMKRMQKRHEEVA